MNVSIIYKETVGNEVLDSIAGKLPDIIAKVMEVPGGGLARLKPGQVSLIFSQASPRDVGADVRIMAFARSNEPRTSTENARARDILEKVLAVTGKGCSVDVRVYLLEVGAAEESCSARGN